MPLMAGNIGSFTGIVNGDLTGCAPQPVRSIYRAMDLPGILDRIERRLRVVELSEHAASQKAGKPDAIRNLRRAIKSGREGMSTATLAALAPVLRTTPGWLTDGVGAEDPDAGIEAPTIPVWGQAGAGGSIHRFHDVTGEIDRIPAPENSNERTGAVEIVGDSLGTLFDRWYAVYDEVRDPPTRDLIGKLCIVETVDGRVMIKRLARGRGKRFTLESNYDPPIYDVEVAWAAPVKNMVPR